MNRGSCISSIPRIASAAKDHEHDIHNARPSNPVYTGPKFNSLLGGKRYEHEEFGDISRDVLNSIEDSLLPDARYVQGPLCTVAESLIVFAFFERALRVVAEDVAIDSASAIQYVKKNHSLGKIHGFIEFLKYSVGLNFDVPSTVLELIERERGLRNCFAHGEWNVAGMLPRENFVSSAFAAMKTFFENLEAAVEEHHR
ncbi:hypothetical protein [Paraburkholderia sp. BR10954]|uniref:hypothetical protein n=1 Tax=Paraburkholderia sp. BR10954 TaxID=3236995 RepID=UPI0034D2B875